MHSIKQVTAVGKDRGQTRVNNQQSCPTMAITVVNWDSATTVERANKLKTFIRLSKSLKKKSSVSKSLQFVCSVLEYHVVEHLYVLEYVPR
jgi:hypothetical protein